MQWEADRGTDYFILVSQTTFEPTTETEFTLTFETNDSLERAFGPLVPGTNTIVAGSTVGARIASDIGACGSASSPAGPGVWYSVVGNGKTITASTCASATSLDTQISVFSAANVCVNGNDDYCTSKSQVAWSSNVDELYFVFVHGKNNEEGTFVLQLSTEGGSIAAGDYCANAELIDVGTTAEIDLSQATVDPDITDCAASLFPGGNTIIGNFYKFRGTGQPVHILMNSTSMSDLCGVVMHSVLTGSSCGTLECVDPACDYDCEVSTIVGQDYYVYVFYIEELYPPEGLLMLSLEGE